MQDAAKTSEQSQSSPTDATHIPLQVQFPAMTALNDTTTNTTTVVPEPDVIRIRGTRKAVDGIKADIQELVAELRHQAVRQCPRGLFFLHLHLLIFFRRRRCRHLLCESF